MAMKKRKLKRNLSLKSAKTSVLNLSNSKANGPKGPSRLTQFGGGGVLAVGAPEEDSGNPVCARSRARRWSLTQVACLESWGRRGREAAHNSRAWEKLPLASSALASRASWSRRTL